MQTPAMAPARSGLEALVGLAVVYQIADAVHRVLEEGGGGRTGVGSNAKSTIGNSPCKSCIIMLFLQGDRAPGIFQAE